MGANHRQFGHILMRQMMSARSLYNGEHYVRRRTSMEYPELSVFLHSACTYANTLDPVLETSS
jgi:hypothetical protein